MTVHRPPPYTPPTPSPPPRPAPPLRPTRPRSGNWLWRAQGREGRVLLILGVVVLLGILAAASASGSPSRAPTSGSRALVGAATPPAARWGSVCTITDTGTGVVEVYARTVMLSGGACVDGHGNPLPDLGAAFTVVDTTAVDGNAPAYPDGAVCSYYFSPRTKSYHVTPTTGVPADATALTTISAPAASYNGALNSCASVGAGASTTN